MSSRVSWNFLERRSNVADSWYCLLADECSSLEHQIVSGGVCSGEMVQWLANVSMVVSAPIDDLNRHTAHAWEAAREIVSAWSGTFRSIFRCFSSRRFQCGPSLCMKRLAMRFSFAR